MSVQAVNWAIEQKAGSPSAKAILWSITNYANHDWVAWPSQRTICDESEQSPDSVQRRLPELEARGIIRRIPLMFAGRKNVDFIILSPSPFFRAPLSDIEPILPKGYVVDRRYVAASCGSAATSSLGDSTSPIKTTTCEPPAPSITDVAADCGSATLPQSAVHAAADVAADCGSRSRTVAATRTLSLEPEDKERGARGPLVSTDAFAISDECHRALSIDPKHPPHDWCGLPYQIQVLLTRGCDRMTIVSTAATLAGRQPRPGMIYFVKMVETAQSRSKTPIIARGNDAAKTADNRTSWQKSRDDFRDAHAQLRAFNEAHASDQDGDETGGPIIESAAAAYPHGS